MKIEIRDAVKKWKQGSFSASDIEYYFGHLEAFFYEVMHELNDLYRTIDALEDDGVDVDRLKNIIGVVVVDE